MNRTRRAIWVVLAGVVGAVSLNTASRDEAVAAALPAVGVQFHATWSDYTDAQRIAVLDKLAAANIRWVRIDLGWGTIEEAGRGTVAQWYVDIFDRVVAAANARGIKVLATLWRSPGWANGGRSAITGPNDPADYARFATWIANRYRGKVAAWEIWNEPNSTSFFAGADPVQYAALVRAAYPAFKAGDPNALVVAGSLQLNDTDWLARLYDAGIAGAYDVLSVHPYQGPADAPPEVVGTGHDWQMDHIGAVRQMMVARGGGTKQLWATEYGWSSHVNTGSEPTWKLGVTEAQQADYFVRSVAWFASRHPYVSNVFWYNEREKATGDPQEDGYGLLRRDLSEKPAYVAIKALLAGGSVLPTTTTVKPTATTTTVKPTTTTVKPTTTTTVKKPTTTTTVKPTTVKPTKPRKDRYAVAAVNGSTAVFPGPDVTSTVASVASGETVVGATTSATTGRMWVASDRGAVRGVGATPSFGDLRATKLNQPIVGVAARPAGDGYWLVARDGGIFSFGDAGFVGSTGALRLNQPIVGMASTPTGRGYWLVARCDGGIFSFGDAGFLGSTGALRLNQPIVGMASTPTGRGYWLVASDGGIFSFGDAGFFGSTGAIRLNQPIVGMAATSTGAGYWFAARDGGIFTFGDAPFIGAATTLGAPVAGLAAML